MNKFVLLVEFQVKPESLEEFLKLVDGNARDSVSKEPGCFQFDVMQTMDDPNHVVLYEVYATEDAFKAHMGMAHTQAFLAAVKPMAGPPKPLRMVRKSAPPVKQG